MFDSLPERDDFIVRLQEMLTTLFDLSNVQIFVFGSFLTENFVAGKSDIDLGIYCPDNDKKCDIELMLEQCFRLINLECDIVDMVLSDKMLINIPIMTYGKPLTPYMPDEMQEYLISMVRKYGFLGKGLEASSYV